MRLQSQCWHDVACPQFKVFQCAAKGCSRSILHTTLSALIAPSDSAPILYMYEGLQLYQCKSADLMLFPAGVLQVWSVCFGIVHLLSHSPRHPAAVALQTVSSISLPIGTMAERSPTSTPLSAMDFDLATWRNNSHPLHTIKGRFLMISQHSAQPDMGAAVMGRRRPLEPCSQSPEGRSGASAHRALVHVQVPPACECWGVFL